MNLKDTLEYYKVNKSSFIEIRNKFNRWLLCDTLSSNRLSDYFQYEVLNQLTDKNIFTIQIDYEDSKTKEYYDWKKSAIPIINITQDKKQTKQYKNKIKKTRN